MIRISDEDDRTLFYAESVEEATKCLFDLGYIFVREDDWFQQEDNLWLQYQFFLEKVS